jgi:hypothetical protein
MSSVGNNISKYIFNDIYWLSLLGDVSGGNKRATWRTHDYYYYYYYYYYYEIILQQPEIITIVITSFKE